MVIVLKTKDLWTIGSPHRKINMLDLFQYHIQLSILEEAVDFT